CSERFGEMGEYDFLRCEMACSFRRRLQAGGRARAGHAAGGPAHARCARLLPGRLEIRLRPGGARHGRAIRGTSESTLVGNAIRVGVANAALANATLAHRLDFDDTREDAIVHTGSVIVTTSLAAGEAAGAPGKAALEAIIAGRGDVSRGPRGARQVPRAALSPGRAGREVRRGGRGRQALRVDGRRAGA